MREQGEFGEITAWGVGLVGIALDLRGSEGIEKEDALIEGPS